ncbi:MAG: mechanosensitive ion channel family protein [Burkholderiales bacterium]|nr:mechanosensitive ion channel family protein [Burkholderiales bacterium]
MELEAVIAGYGNRWLATLAVAVVAVAVALVAWTIVASALRRLARLSVPLTRLVEHARAPARLVAPLIALQFVFGVAPDDLATMAAVRRITALALIAAITWLVISAVQAVAQAIVELHPANVSDNLEARRVHTQTRVLSRVVMFIVGLVGIGAALMTFPNVRQIGASLLASAGVAGLVAGIAARPVIGSLIAGLQIALTQPIRLDDVVIIEGEWGRIEEITATYVVVKVWDERRLVVPLSWFIEHPFQNWTRRSAQLLGTVMLWLDYRVALAPLRAELERVCKAASEWDGRVALLQVTDTTERAMQVRLLVSSTDASKLFDLRCRVREALIDFLQRQEPDGLPRLRAEIEQAEKRAGAKAPQPPPEHAGVGDSSAIRHPDHAVKHAPPPPKEGERVARSDEQVATAKRS